MEKLADYDPLALTAIEFNIKSVKKYTSVATILISLSVLAVSIVINLEAIKHLWIPLHELPSFYSIEKFSDKAQTEDNIVCFTSPVPFPSKPSLTITYMENGQLLTKERAPLEGTEGCAYMDKHVEGKDYACFELAGVSFVEEGEKATFNLPVSQGNEYTVYRR